MSECEALYKVSPTSQSDSVGVFVGAAERRAGLSQACSCSFIRMGVWVVGGAVLFFIAHLFRYELYAVDRMYTLRLDRWTGTITEIRQLVDGYAFTRIRE